MLYSGLRILESTVLRPEQTEQPIVSKTINRGNISYFPRQDITVVLVMGIDQFGPVTDSETYNNRGAADMVMLLIFDEKNEVCNVLHLNRDTMVKIPVLGLDGREAGTYFGQIALAHTYGSGLEDSCENTVHAVSDFLYGIRIDHYLSMHMDAIAILNDAVGGVTVEITEDFSKVDPAMTMGTMTLKGEQAIHFVRTRKDVGDQKNLSRMERQKTYIDAFVESFRESREADPEFIARAYQDVSDYMVTDCTVNAVSGMIDRFGGYAIGKVVSPAGENRMGETYYEFYVDEEKLDSLILELFYAPKK
jgi:LCP family protein required for cell wall assembly